MSRLTLSTSDKKIAGVCGGLAKWTNINTSIMRLSFVITALFMAGSPILIYILLALILD